MCSTSISASRTRAPTSFPASGPAIAPTPGIMPARALAAKGASLLARGPTNLVTFLIARRILEELVGLVLVFAQAHFAEYLADLLFAFQFGVAVRITIMA